MATRHLGHRDTGSTLEAIRLGADRVCGEAFGGAQDDRRDWASAAGAMIGTCTVGWALMAVLLALRFAS